MIGPFTWTKSSKDWLVVLPVKAFDGIPLVFTRNKQNYNKISNFNEMWKIQMLNAWEYRLDSMKEQY